jgi:hypothetical protein
VKTDANGIHEWNATFGGPDSDFPGSMILSSDGGYVLAGGSDSFNGSWLVKTNTTGHHLWNTTFEGMAFPNSLIQTLDGGFVLAGERGDYPNTDFLLLKTDANGNHEWNVSFGGLEWDVATSVIQLADGSFLLAGVTRSFGALGSDCWLIKTNSTGHHLWNQTYGNLSDEEVQSLIQTADGGLLLAIISQDLTADTDVWLLKTDSTGEREWDEFFGSGFGENVVSSVLQLSDGSFILAGGTEAKDGRVMDMWLFKIRVIEETATTTTPTTTTTTTATTTTAAGNPGFDLEVLVISLGLIFFISRKRRL